MSYDDWKTTDPADRNYKRCPNRECGTEIDIRDCLQFCPECGQDLRQHEPDPDVLYDAWRDRQFERE
jgi:hypothetical protein